MMKAMHTGQIYKKEGHVEIHFDWQCVMKCRFIP
jgi:hypothetical protein